jgi:hypothetical protein
MLGSNQRPPPCRDGALPAELIALGTALAYQRRMGSAHPWTLAPVPFEWQRRRGGVATQRPAKPSTPVRFRSSPLKSPANRRFWLSRCADDRLLSHRSPKKPSAWPDFGGHLQRICPATDASIPALGQKAVDGCHSRKRSRAGRRRAHSLVSASMSNHRGTGSPTLASVCRSGHRQEKAAGAPRSPAAFVASQLPQKRRPALADIIGPRRAWTVAMISSVSIPCR